MSLLKYLGLQGGVESPSSVQRGRGLVELCRMRSRLTRGCDVGINVVLSAGRYIEDLGAQQRAPVLIAVSLSHQTTTETKLGRKFSRSHPRAGRR
jgi:hypothetical protein